MDIQTITIPNIPDYKTDIAMTTIQTQQNEQDFEHNINSLDSELNEKRQEVENIKLKLKSDKGDYNQKIRKYNEVNSTVMEKEKTLENVNKKMTQVKFKKKIIVSNINLDFFEHFHDSLPRLTKDVSDLIFQFVGFKKTHPMIIKKMIVDEKELINLMNYMDMYNDSENIKNTRVSFINANVNSDKVEETGNNGTNNDIESPESTLILQIKNKYCVNNHINILYPFNHIFEYILHNEEYHKLENEKNKIMEDIDQTQLNKNVIFMNLKNLEKEILKNDNLYRNLTKQVKLITTILDKYRQLKSKETSKENNEKLKEYERIINNFKKFNNTIFNRKYDNMNSLTLKSEYSEEYSELMKDAEETMSPRQFRKNREEKKDSNKNNETLENILLGLNKKDDEPSKNIKIKNMKQIKNKRLNSDDIDLNFSDNKSGANNGFNKKMSKPNTNTNDMLIEPIDEGVGPDGPGPELGTSVDNTNPNKQTKEKNESNPTLEITKSQKSLREEKPQSSFGPSQTTKNRNMSAVNSVLKENLLDKKIVIANTGKIPSFSVHNNKNINNSNGGDQSVKSNKISDNYSRVVLEETKDKIEIENSFIVKTNIPSNKSVNDGWFVAPMNKIPVRASKLISDTKDLRSKGLRNLHEYLNIKIDKEAAKNSGCCMSCV